MAEAVRAIEDRPQLGIAMMLGAWFMFSLVDTSAKWLVTAGVPAFMLAFTRYFGHFVISTGILMRDGFQLRDLSTPQMGPLILRASLLAAATLSNFIALRYLPLTVTSAIMFSSPIIVCLLSFSMLGERVGPWRWSAILLGFVGVLIVIRPFGDAFHPAMLLPVFNSFALAFYALLTRRMAGVVSTDVMQFWMGAVGTITMLPFALIAWEAPTSALEWSLLVGLGIFGWAGHQLLTTAHRFGPANLLMPYTYSFMLYLSVLGYLVFGHVPDFWTVAGAMVIIGSGLIIWKREQA